MISKNGGKHVQPGPDHGDRFRTARAATPTSCSDEHALGRLLGHRGRPSAAEDVWMARRVHPVRRRGRGGCGRQLGYPRLGARRPRASHFQAEAGLRGARSVPCPNLVFFQRDEAHRGHGSRSSRSARRLSRREHGGQIGKNGRPPRRRPSKSPASSETSTGVPVPDAKMSSCHGRSRGASDDSDWRQLPDPVSRPGGTGSRVWGYDGAQPVHVRVRALRSSASTSRSASRPPSGSRAQ